MAINRLIPGDGLEVRKGVDAEIADAVRLDPPFFSASAAVRETRGMPAAFTGGSCGARSLKTSLVWRLFQNSVLEQMP
jgi:hypothetical protein